MFRENLASLVTPLCMVAESITVCLLLLLSPCSALRSRSLMILETCSSKPMSTSLSASSSTKYLRSEHWKASVFSRWSKSLPGVHVSTLIPFLSLAFSLERFSPPMMVPGTIQ